MKILDNELVRRYFGDEDTDNPCTPCGIALYVLTAMEEEIKVGEKCLALTYGIPGSVQWQEATMTQELLIGWYHPFYLRLPEKFQKKECEWGMTCPACKGVMTHQKICEHGGDKAECDSAKRGDPFKPQPAPESINPKNCDCGRAAWQDHSERCSCLKPEAERCGFCEEHKNCLCCCGGLTHKPSARVEEKI